MKRLPISIWAAYDNKGQLDRAIREYDQAIRLEPDNESAYTNRGIAYRKKRLYDQAIRDYDEAIRRNPDYTASYPN